MYDNSLYFSTISDKKSRILTDLAIKNKPYILATVHRNDNTDSSLKLNELFHTFLEIIKIHQIKIILPIHPRTTKMMDQLLEPNLKKEIKKTESLKIIPPVGFLDMIALEKNALLIITDSGGVQKESYFFKKPCIILRPQTEWVEIVATKSAIITHTDSVKILTATPNFLNHPELQFPPIFGDANAASFIVKEMISQFS